MKTAEELQHEQDSGTYDGVPVEFFGDSAVVTILSGVPRYIVVGSRNWRFSLANACGEGFFSHREAIHYAQTGQKLDGHANRDIALTRENTPLDVLFADQEVEHKRQREARVREDELLSKLEPLDDDD